MSDHLRSSAPRLESRVADLYDFSLDITRHDADIAFARAGGTIHYVLDENILELFINPAENYGFVMRDDLRHRSRRGPSDRETQALQSALLTGEVLLGGALPGQTGGRCYLTEWHRWEALERVGDFVSNLASNDADRLKQTMASSLNVKAALFEGVEPDIHGSGDPFLHGDIEQLRDTGIDPEVAKDMARVRTAATALARDRRSEPISQLHRVLQFDVEGHLSLATKILAPQRGDMPRLAKEAETWDRLIRQEATARAARHRTARRKTRTAIWNDAQSLALIDWLSRKLDPEKERVVFVTGDSTLFDTYRRQFEEKPEQAQSKASPFLLRRAVQYSTLFSVEDDTMRSIRSELFYSLQQLVELPLTPIRMASVSSPGVDPEVFHRRYSLTLGRIGRASDRRPYFNDVWKAFGDDYREEQIDSVERQIEQTERFLNGLSGHLLERRIAEEQRNLIVHSAGDVEKRVRLVESYVERAVDNLIRSALAVWRPEAEAFFRRAAQEGPKRAKRHVPLAITPGSTDGERRNLLEMLDALFEDPIEEGSGGRPVSFNVTTSFDLFLGAAAVALHGNQWRLGDHFCEVAINAFTYLQRYEATSAADAAEAYYLGALAKRFRLGAIRILDPSDVSGLERLFSKAMDLLRRSEDLGGDAGAGFVSYRTYSERAALCLFQAVQMHRAARRASSVTRPRRGDALLSRAADAFSAAGVYLTEVVRIGTRSGYGRTAPALHGPPVERLRLQILVNIAAWHALRPIIAPHEAPRPDLARDCVLALPALLDMVGRSSSPLFDMELQAFLMSVGLDRTGPLRSVASDRQAGVRGLSVDREALQILQSFWMDGKTIPDRGSAAPTRTSE